MRPNQMDLDALLDYAARPTDSTPRERCDRALTELSRNVGDTRFPATAKRTVTIKIECEPDEDRRDVRTFVTVETKFPNERAPGAMVYMNTDAATGEEYATVGKSDKQGELAYTAPVAETPAAKPVVAGPGSTKIANG